MIAPDQFDVPAEHLPIDQVLGAIPKVSYDVDSEGKFDSGVVTIAKVKQRRGHS
jgi:hypothetical protein